jgi:hypothetical protein
LLLLLLQLLLLHLQLLLLLGATLRCQEPGQVVNPALQGNQKQRGTLEG